MTDALNRRDLCTSLAAFATLAAASAASASAQQEPAGRPEIMAAPAPSNAKAGPLLDTTRAFAFPDLPVSKSANGESRPVTHGVLPTGESVELHETTLLPGHMPHPPHQHRHSEFILVREGQLQLIEPSAADPDRATATVGPGGVLFFASNKMHGLKNIGSTTANYFVIAIGHES